MTYKSLVAVIAMVIAISCNTQKKEPLETHKYTNALITETSPYLLQHAHNPVNWRAWNNETLAKAKAEKKLMVISVGYAACHWCHVMERESFEDSTVAAVMNKNFISVKVDREERPDIDQIYINAVQLMKGAAGWPLNVITLPDGRPIFGGTYFKKEEWMQALTQVQTIYEKDPEKVEQLASQLEEGIKTMDLITLNTENVDFEKFPTNDLVENWKQGFDTTFGGPKRAPKFMMPNNYHFLLRYAVQSKDSTLLNYVTLTLDKMAYGGVYDHVGGGFSRYSTDIRWHVPHFEKMLYDNAQLVSLYSDAYLVTKNPLYMEVVTETLDYIATEMTHKNGAFYSSLDADSDNEEGELEEGAYYVFTMKELQELLSDDFELFSTYYNVNDYGKWENDHYVLIRTKSDAEIISEFSMTSEMLTSKKKGWKKLLSAHRNKRDRPRLDDKSLTSWNALMLKGYVDAYKTFGTKEYLDVALKNANFIRNNQLQEKGALYHIYKDGNSSINGYLEDYALTAEAFIALYEVTLDEKWLHQAKQLTDYSFDYFFNSESGMFYFTSSEDEQLITRNTEYRDNVIPGSNSVQAKNLFKLSHYFDSPRYTETVHQMVKNVLPEAAQYPAGFSNWLDVLTNYQSDFYEIVVAGPDAKDKITEINQFYVPNKLIAGAEKQSEMYLLEGRYVDGNTFIYVCVNNTCKLPMKETNQAIEAVR